MPGRYLVNLSRLDMSITIFALKNLLNDIVYDKYDKQCYAIEVLISILEREQDGQDPKVKYAFKNTQEGCAKVWDVITKDAKNK